MSKLKVEKFCKKFNFISLLQNIYVHFCTFLMEGMQSKVKFFRFICKLALMQ